LSEMTDTGNAFRIGVVAPGSRSQSYAHALAQVDGTRITAAMAGTRAAAELQRLFPSIALERDIGSLASRADLHALLVVDPVADLFGILRRALLSNKHVLASMVSPISSRQLQELSFLARRRSRLLMFVEERPFHPALVFLRWMVSGRSGLWHPHYLRGLFAPGAGYGSGASMAALVIEELALCARLLDASPVSVSAVVCRAPAEATPVAAFIHLNYPEGQVVSLEISLVEAQEARQWALATSSKTVFLDECDTRSPLKIISLSSEPASQSLLSADPPVPLTDWPTESSVTPPFQSTDVRVEQLRYFVESALKRDLRQSNVSFWAEVASTWEATQESINLSGVPVNVVAQSGDCKEQVGERPKLRLIHGKGMGNIGARKKPALTVVSR
jgi:predicted dehydrogenase